MIEPDLILTDEWHGKLYVTEYGEFAGVRTDDKGGVLLSAAQIRELVAELTRMAAAIDRRSAHVK